MSSQKCFADPPGSVRIYLDIHHIDLGTPVYLATEFSDQLDNPTQLPYSRQCSPEVSCSFSLFLEPLRFDSQALQLFNENSRREYLLCLEWN